MIGVTEYEISDEPSRIDVDAVCAFLRTQVYWGRWRSEAVIRAQITAAWRVVGAYLIRSPGQAPAPDRRPPGWRPPDGAQVGFARAFSDGFAAAYLADVYVLPEHRGHGLGKRLVRAMIDEGPGARFRWMLHTNGAHGLYGQFGFATPEPTYLERPGRHP